MTVNLTHVIDTPCIGTHSADAAMSRHREVLALHYGRDDFPDQSMGICTLSRGRDRETRATTSPSRLPPADPITGADFRTSKQID